MKKFNIIFISLCSLLLLLGAGYLIYDICKTNNNNEVEITEPATFDKAYVDKYVSQKFDEINEASKLSDEYLSIARYNEFLANGGSNVYYTETFNGINRSNLFVMLFDADNNGLGVSYQNFHNKLKYGNLDGCYLRIRCNELDDIINCTIRINGKVVLRLTEYPMVMDVVYTLNNEVYAIDIEITYSNPHAINCSSNFDYSYILDNYKTSTLVDEIDLSYYTGRYVALVFKKDNATIVGVESLSIGSNAIDYDFENKETFALVIFELPVTVGDINLVLNVEGGENG